MLAVALRTSRVFKGSMRFRGSSDIALGNKGLNEGEFYRVLC